MPDESTNIYMDQESFINNMQIFCYENQNAENYLSQKENKMLHKTTGQLSGISSQTRPDLAYDAFFLSTILNPQFAGGGVDSAFFLRDRLWGPDGVSFDPKMSM